MFQAVSLVDGGMGKWRPILEKLKHSKRERRTAKTSASLRHKSPKPYCASPNHPNTPLKTLIRLIATGRIKGGEWVTRDCRKYKAWRIAVLTRDGHRCLRCWSKRNLQAHHCHASFFDHPERRLDIRNGVTLCRECHAKLHPWMRSDATFLARELHRTEKQQHPEMRPLPGVQCGWAFLQTELDPNSLEAQHLRECCRAH